MTAFRAIPLSVHAGVEMFAGPAVMAAPFVLGFGEAAAILAVLVGVALTSLALQVPGPRRSIPLAVHASYDYALALFTVLSGLAVGLVTGAWEHAIFLVGIGAAMVALTASTRFSLPRGA